MKLLFILICFISASSSAFASWDLNDVSYLMPLPLKIGSDNLLRLEASGRGGALLPTKFLSIIPQLTVDNTDAQIAASLRVVGMRIDPCFPLPTPQSCQKQLRLIWQPLQSGYRNQTETIDAALHSFYVLSDEDFTNLLTDLAAWKTKYKLQTQGLPLQIHPAWAQQGDQSLAFADFNSIVRKYAGTENLIRVTAMIVRGDGNMWAFQGFSVKNGELELLKIPRIDRAAQTFVNFAIPVDHFDRGRISPEPQSPNNNEDTFNQVIRNSQNFKTANEDVLRKELRAMYRIENPTQFNPENTDCVSCHVAQTAREWVQRNRADIGIQNIWQENAYQNSRYNLQNYTPVLANTQVIRAFGYYGPNMAISQRVINESAAVADQLNKISNKN